MENLLDSLVLTHILAVFDQILVRFAIAAVDLDFDWHSQRREDENFLVKFDDFDVFRLIGAHVTTVLAGQFKVVIFAAPLVFGQPR